MSVFKSLRNIPARIANRMAFIRFRPDRADYPVINGRLMLFSGKNAKISFGSHVKINSGIRFNPIGGDSLAIIYAMPGATISIGSNCGISNSAIVARQSVVIEDDVLIGGGCKIYDNDFHSIRFEERSQKPDPGIVSKPVVIRQGAFIGAHSIILKGVTVGRHSVIGAGSVVVCDVPDNEVWAGNPAVFVKKAD